MKKASKEDRILKYNLAPRVFKNVFNYELSRKYSLDKYENELLDYENIETDDNSESSIVNRVYMEMTMFIDTKSKFYFYRIRERLVKLLNVIDDCKEETINVIKDIIIVASENEYDDLIIEAIEVYFEKMIENADSNTIRVGPNVDALCKSIIDAGDKRLFLYGDIKTAIKWYRLILNYKKFSKLDGRSKNVKDYIRKIRGIIDCIEDNAGFECIFSLSGKEFNHFYTAVLNESSSDEKRLEASNRFLNSLEYEIENIDKSRDLLVLANVVINKNLKFAIKKFENNINYAKNIMLRIKNSYLTEYIELYKAISNLSKKNLEYSINFVYSYINVSLLIEKIKGKLIVTNNYDKIAYYTKLETLMYMMPCKCKSIEDAGKLSFMNMSYMNDPNEGKLIENYLLDGKISEKRNSAYCPGVYMKCFTDRIDDLPMWEMYGDKSKGCCLVLNYGSLDDYEKNELPLYRVCYIRINDDEIVIENENLEDKEEIINSINQIKNIISKFDNEFISFFNKELDEIKYLFKDSKYMHENETRIVFFVNYGDKKINSTGNSEYPLLFLQPDVTIPIDELILGPKFEDFYTKLPYIESQMANMRNNEKKETLPKITFSSINYK